MVFLFPTETSSSALNFVANQPPQNGSCSVSPLSGTTSTVFTISCPQWQDPDGIKDYSFYSEILPFFVDEGKTILFCSRLDWRSEESSNRCFLVPSDRASSTASWTGQHLGALSVCIHSRSIGLLNGSDSVVGGRCGRLERDQQLCSVCARLGIDEQLTVAGAGKWQSECGGTSDQSAVSTVQSEQHANRSGLHRCVISRHSSPTSSK